MDSRLRHARRRPEALASIMVVPLSKRTWPHPTPANTPARRSLRDRLASWWLGLDARAGRYLGLAFLVCVFAHLLVLFTVGITDEPTRLMAVARNLLEGRGYSFCNAYFPFCGEQKQVTASVEPVPVLMFAAATKLFGARVLAAIFWLQMAANLGTLLVVYLLGVRVLRQRRAALAAAFLMGVYLPAARLTVKPHDEPFFAFLLCLGSLAFLRALDARGPGAWVAAGAGFGLAALTRSSFLFFPLLLVLLFVPLLKLPLSRRLSRASVLLLAFSLTISPWAIRNARVFHALVPGGTLVGYNLYRHNHVLAEDEFIKYVDADEAAVAVADLVASRPDLRGDENEVEMDRVYRAAALSIIEAHPLRFVELSVFRLFSLWLGVENISGHASPVHLLFALENFALLILACFAVFRRRSVRSLGVLAILALPVYITLVHVMVVGQMRYVIPIVPFVCLLAADEATALLDGRLRLAGPSPAPLM